MNRISLIGLGCLLLMAFTNIALAQNYSSDAVLVNTAGNIVTIRSSGSAEKKKEAIEMAIKSTFYAYLVSGIDGVNDNKPLLGKTISPAAQEYLKGILEGGRYSVFVKSYTVDDKASKSVAKIYQTIVSVEIYDVSLKRDLTNNKLLGSDPSNMSLLDTQEKITIPTIMVVPYCVSGESFQDVIQKNADIRMAMSKVREQLISEGVEVDDVEQAIRNAGTFEAVQGDLSLNDIIINNATADVMVYVDMKKDITNEGVRVNLILSAVEVANRKVIASKSEISGRKKTTPDVVCGALAQYIAPDFLRQISTAIARKIEKGNSLSVKFAISAGSNITMDSKLGPRNLPLSDLLILWIRKSAQNGKYRQQGRSSSLLSLSEIQIPNKDANGNDMDVNNFSLELYLYLSEELGLEIDRNVVGNILDVTIK